MLSIHVISLPAATLRRRHVEEQLQAGGYDFEYFDAIDGAKLTENDTPAVNTSLYRLNTGRDPSAGELGCFMSHRALWQRAARSDKALIILEDDFKLRPSFRQVSSLARTTVENLGVIRLQNENRMCKYPIFGEEGRTFWRYTKVPFGACAYIVSPAAARTLVHASRVIEAPVDAFLKMPWKFGLPIHAMTPYPVELNGLSLYSQIDGRNRKVKSRVFTLRRALHRGKNWFSRLRFNHFCQAMVDAEAISAATKVQPVTRDIA